jgi:hypothetical protein
MTASALLLLRRSAFTYASAIAAIGFFVVLAACYGELMTTGGMAFVVPGVLAIAGAPLWLDVSKGMKAQHAVDRMAVGLGSTVALLYLAGLLSERRVFSHRAENLTVLVLLCLSPLLVALGSGLRRPQRYAWFVEAVIVAVGGIGWLLILRRAVLVSSMVALGPSVAWACEVPRWIPYSLLDSAWGFLLTPLALPFAAMSALRVDRHWSRTAAAFVGECLFGVILLAWAYRLAGVVAICVLLSYRLITRATALWPRVYALVVLLCILPVDVSLQRGGVNGLRFLPGRGGDYTGEVLRDPPSHGFVLVGEGFYYSPRVLWVW